MRAIKIAGLAVVVVALGIPAAQAGNTAFEGRSSGDVGDWYVKLRAKEHRDEVVKIAAVNFIVLSHCELGDQRYDQRIGPKGPFELGLKVGSDRRFSYSGEPDSGWELEVKGRITKNGSKAKGTIGFTTRHRDVVCTRDSVAFVAPRR